MSEVAELLQAIASVLWVGVVISALFIVARVLLTSPGSLKTLVLGPTGLSMEFVEAKVAQAVDQSPQGSDSGVGFAAKRSVVDRLQRHADLLADARILWVDDHPENNAPILELFRRYGAVIDCPTSNPEALRLLRAARYDVIISDVGRDSEGPDSELKGLELAETVYRQWSQQVVLFTARFNPATVPGVSPEARLELVRRVQRSVFGMTNRVDIAVHLILDVLER